MYSTTHCEVIDFYSVSRVESIAIMPTDYDSASRAQILPHYRPVDMYNTNPSLFEEALSFTLTAPVIER
jgi:hypothetical protein